MRKKMFSSSKGQTFKPLYAVQHIRRMRGGSQAHLIRGSDGDYWIVKFQGNPQCNRVLANEFLASRIGRCLGLPMPKTDIIEVSDALIASTPELCFELGGHRMRCKGGLHLASRFVADPDRDLILDYLLESQFCQVMNREDFPRCLVMDKWTGNTDGRQVVFSRISKYLGYKMHFVDQGYCFNANDWDFPDLALNGVYYRNYVYAQVTGWESFEPTLSRAEQSTLGNLKACARYLPKEWYQTDEGNPLPALLETLHKRRLLIRDLITKFRQHSRNPFPNWKDRPMVSVPAMPAQYQECRA